jgi:hypothetical protein
MRDNYDFSESSPNPYWHRLERHKSKVDDHEKAVSESNKLSEENP